MKASPIPALRKVLLILIGLIILNYVCRHFIGPFFYKLPCSNTVALYVESIIRSIFLLVVSIVVCYKWKVSDEINRIIRKTLKIKE